MSTRVPPALPTLRRRPKQARSRVTVEIIVEAGARVLGALGWDKFTTNKVAAAAGVSIGSLYQYFPDKASLVEAIRAKHLADCLLVLRICHESDLRGAELVRQLVSELIAVHSTSPGLHRVLLDELPERYSDRLSLESRYEHEYLGYYAAIVGRLLAVIPPENADRAAILISDAVDGVIHNAARRGTLHEPGLHAGLVTLITRYVGISETGG